MKALLTSSHFRPRIAVALLAAASATLSPCLLRAQPAAAEVVSPQETYRRAHKAIGSKNWEEARRLLLELWAQSETYDVAASLGQVEFWLKHYADGARYLSFALRNAPPAEKTEVVERIRTGLAELKKHVGTARVTVNEPGAEVRVDAELIGTSPLVPEIYLEPGPHRFEARLGAAPPTEVTLEAQAGQVYDVSLLVQPASADAVSAAPAPNAEPPAERAATDAERTPPGRSKVPLYIAGGVAALGAGIGIALTLAASRTGDEINDLKVEVGSGGCTGMQSPACSELVEAAERRDGQKNASYVSFAVAGAAVVTGAVYLLWPSSSARRSSVGVTWLPGGTLVTLHGAL